MPVIHIKKHENNFVQIDKRPLSDDRLTWKAKGIWVYLMSKPPDWKIYVGDLVKRSKGGEHAVRAAMKELIKFGYAERKARRGKDGKIEEWEFYVYEQPDRGFQHVDNLDVENLHVENLPLTKNKDTKNEDTNNLIDSSAKADNGYFDPFEGLDEEPEPQSQEKSKTAYVQAMELLEAAFAVARECDPPDWESDPKVSQKRWRTPLGRMWRKIGKDSEKAERAVRAVTLQMKNDGLTFDAPDQIEKTYGSWIIDNIGKNGNGSNGNGSVVVAPSVEKRKSIKEFENV